jgi:hypothetical protein
MEDPSAKRKNGDRNDTGIDYVGNAQRSSRFRRSNSYGESSSGGSTGGVSGANGPPPRPKSRKKRRQSPEDQAVLATLLRAEQEAGPGASPALVKKAVNKAMPTILARAEARRDRDGQDDDGTDNGLLPFDTLGNIPIGKFNKSFESSSWDRRLITISLTLATGTQSDTTLLTTTFPCVLTGFAWKLLSNFNTTIAFEATALMALRIVRQGNAVTTLNKTTNNSTFVSPEADVCLYDILGYGCNTGSTLLMMRSTQKSNSAYKMNIGDTLVYSAICESPFDSNPMDVDGVLEFWINV